MKHPVRSDFHTVVTEAGVTVTFKPTNSIYSFYRLADSDDVARLGPVSLERVRHTGRGTHAEIAKLALSAGIEKPTRAAICQSKSPASCSMLEGRVSRLTPNRVIPAAR